MVVGRRSFPFWETPFSGTFVVSFRESTFFGCQRSLCLRGISGLGKFGGFLNWLQVGGLCKERLFFYGQNLSPPPPKQNSSLEMQKNFEHISCQVIQSKWPFWGMVKFRDPFKWLKTWPPTIGDEVWSHPLTWWLLLFESSWSCNLDHPKCAQDSRREPTRPEAAHTTPMEQNNVTLEQLQLQWVMIFTFCNQQIGKI